MNEIQQGKLNVKQTNTHLIVNGESIEIPKHLQNTSPLLRIADGSISLGSYYLDYNTKEFKTTRTGPFSWLKFWV